MTSKKQTSQPEPLPVVDLFRLAEAMNMERSEKAVPGGFQVNYVCRLCKGKSKGVADEILHMESCPLNRLK